METTIVSDEQLMSQLISGDETALELLYDRHAGIVLGLAFKILQDNALAEEIVQETFWRVWKKRDSFASNKGRFSSWLYGITRNLAIDNYRQRKVRPQAAASEAVAEKIDKQAADTPSVLDEMAAGDQQQHVKEALSVLPAKQREVIEMAYFNGLTRQEIAAQTGQPVGTIHTRARLGLQKLRHQLQAMGVE